MMLSDSVFDQLLVEAGSIRPSTETRGVLITWGGQESWHWFASEQVAEQFGQVVFGRQLVGDQGGEPDLTIDDINVVWQGTWKELCESSNEIAQQVRVAFWEGVFGLTVGEEGFWPFYPDHDMPPGGENRYPVGWIATVIDADHESDFLNYLRRDFAYHPAYGARSDPLR